MGKVLESESQYVVYVMKMMSKEEKNAVSRIVQSHNEH